MNLFFVGAPLGAKLVSHTKLESRPGPLLKWLVAHSAQ